MESCMQRSLSFVFLHKQGAAREKVRSTVVQYIYSLCASNSQFFNGFDVRIYQSKA